MTVIHMSDGGVVWKYPLDFDGSVSGVFEFATGSILRVDRDPKDELCMWVAVIDQTRTISRRVTVRGTGDPLPDGDWVYLNSFMDDPFVFHAFVGMP